jgi:hypothetical protein
MGECFGIRDIIGGHDVDIRIIIRGSEKIPADPTETVDSDFNTHDVPPFFTFSVLT